MVSIPTPISTPSIRRAWASITSRDSRSRTDASSTRTAPGWTTRSGRSIRRRSSASARGRPWWNGTATCPRSTCCSGRRPRRVRSSPGARARTRAPRRSYELARHPAARLHGRALRHRAALRPGAGGLPPQCAIQPPRRPRGHVSGGAAPGGRELLSRGRAPIVARESIAQRRSHRVRRAVRGVPCVLPAREGAALPRRRRAPRVGLPRMPPRGRRRRARLRGAGTGGREATRRHPLPAASGGAPGALAASHRRHPRGEPFRRRRRRVRSGTRSPRGRALRRRSARGERRCARVGLSRRARARRGLRGGERGLWRGRRRGAHRRACPRGRVRSDRGVRARRSARVSARCALAAVAAVLLLIGSGASRCAPPPPRVEPGPRATSALRVGMLAERIAKLQAQVGQGILPERSNRALVATIRDFDATLKAVAASAPPGEIRDNYALLSLLWNDYREFALRAPTRENARKLRERNEEVAWIAAKGARMIQEHARAATNGSAVRAAGAAMLSQRIPKLYLWRR